MTEYIVQSGDTLRSISARKPGNANRSYFLNDTELTELIKKFLNAY